MCGVGYLRQIRGQITTSLARRITAALPRGILKVMPSGNGNLLVVFYGSMAFVRESPSPVLHLLIVLCVIAGSGKTVLSFVPPQIPF
jgi:hypothetical protein